MKAAITRLVWLVHWRLRVDDVTLSKPELTSPPDGDQWLVAVWWCTLCWRTVDSGNT